MDQTQWGPPMWRFLHAMCTQYTAQRHKEYEAIMNSLAVILPCSVCRRNYLVHILEVPFPCQGVGRKKVQNWLIAKHNAVNRSLGRPSLTQEAAYKRIATFSLDRELPLVLAIFKVHAESGRVSSGIGAHVYRRVHGSFLQALWVILASGRRAMGPNTDNWSRGKLRLPLQAALKMYVKPKHTSVHNKNSNK